MAYYEVIELLEVAEVEPTPYNGKWAIKQMHPTASFVEVGDDPKDLCKRLKGMKYLKTSDMRKLTVSSMDKDIIDILEKKEMKPICRLQIARWYNK